MKDRATDRTELAEKLIELRHSKGLNQRQASEAIGIDYQNYRKYETISYLKRILISKLRIFMVLQLIILWEEQIKNSVKRKR